MASGKKRRQFATTYAETPEAKREHRGTPSEASPRGEDADVVKPKTTPDATDS